MTLLQRERVKEIIGAALDSPPSQRLPNAIEACGSDGLVLAEVERLLACSGEADCLILTPEFQAVDVLAAMAGSEFDPLPAGTLLGPYRIEEVISCGGMGVVYRAADTRLDRTVAIKVNAIGFHGRFRQEAQAIASLNHPNICTLHDVGAQDGLDYLVMEYLEGETLDRRLASGRVPAEEALAWARAILSGLAEAHKRHIVHRDLKPSNIMITRRGIKLLDFGLATNSQAKSAAGELLLAGTVPYMAPEQLRGEEADQRSDIFSFGLVLFEALTGKRAFDGPDRGSRLGSIEQTAPPPVSTVLGSPSPELDWIVAGCLRSDPAERWQSATDLLRLLDWPSAAALAKPGRSFVKTAWVAAGVLGVLTLAALVFVANRAYDTPSQGAHTFRSHLAPPSERRFSYGFLFNRPAISPESTRIVFSAEGNGRSVLYLRNLSSLAVQELPGTEGGTGPFWSPDGQQIGFFAQGKLRRLNLAGAGPPVTLTDGLCCGSWSRNGDIVYSPGTYSPIHRVGVQGGKAVAATRLEPGQAETGHYIPQFLPDGRRFLFIGVSTLGLGLDQVSLYAGSLDSPGAVRKIAAVNWSAVFVPPGLLLYARGQALFAQPFDPERLQLREPAIQIAEHAQAISFAASPEALVFAPPAPTVMAWLDRRGNRQGTIGDPGDYSNPELSPDGKILAVGIRDASSETRDIWLFDLARGARVRLTTDAADEFNPTWSPDGKRIVFGSTRNGRRDLFARTVGSSDPDQTLYASPSDKSPESWSSDGKTLLFNSRRSIWALPLDGRSEPGVAVREIGSADQAAFSPDGKFVAYRGSKPGQPEEVFIRNFPPTERRWQISANGGTNPRWSPDGRTVYYLRPPAFWAVDLRISGAQIEAGPPRLLFKAPIIGTGPRSMFAVSPDGQRFLALLRSEEMSSQLTLVVNWAAKLRK